MRDQRIRRAETVMALVAGLLAAAFLWAGWGLKPGAYEPIGSGTVPNGIAWITLALAIFIGGRAILDRTAFATSVRERWPVALASACLLGAYVAALYLQIASFRWATAIYLTLAIVAISPTPRKTAPWAVLVAVILGFGIDYVFRVLLATDLQ